MSPDSKSWQQHPVATRCGQRSTPEERVSFDSSPQSPCQQNPCKTRLGPQDTTVMTRVSAGHSYIRQHRSIAGAVGEMRVARWRGQAGIRAKPPFTVSVCTRLYLTPIPRLSRKAWAVAAMCSAHGAWDSGRHASQSRADSSNDGIERSALQRDTGTPRAGTSQDLQVPEMHPLGLVAKHPPVS